MAEKRKALAILQRCGVGGILTDITSALVKKYGVPSVIGRLISWAHVRRFCIYGTRPTVITPRRWGVAFSLLPSIDVGDVYGGSSGPGDVTLFDIMSESEGNRDDVPDNGSALSEDEEIDPEYGPVSPGDLFRDSYIEDCSGLCRRYRHIGRSVDMF